MYDFEKMVPINTRMYVKDWNRFKDYCKKSNLTPSYVIRQLIAELLTKELNKNGNG